MQDPILPGTPKNGLIIRNNCFKDACFIFSSPTKNVWEQWNMKLKKKTRQLQNETSLDTLKSFMKCIPRGLQMVIDARKEQNKYWLF